jgi:hypothetical protein
MTTGELVANLLKWRTTLNRTLHPIYTAPKEHSITKQRAEAIWLILSEVDMLLLELEQRV